MNQGRNFRIRNSRSWVRLSIAAAALAAAGAGVTACTQVAVPTGPPPAQNTPSSASPSPHRSAKTPKAPTAPRSTPQTKTGHGKSAPPVRPKGNIRQHSETHKVSYRKGVSLNASAKFNNGVKVSVVRVRPVTAKALGPGEIGGPALALTVMIKNGSTVPIDLSTATVTLTGSDGMPGIMASGQPTSPLAGTLKPSASAKGIYVFTIAKKLRRPITVQVQYGPGQTVLQFSGNAG